MKMEIGNLIECIIGYENSEMTEEEVITFFQFLYDTGLWTQLQGHYHRTMRYLIEEGLVDTNNSEYPFK